MGKLWRICPHDATLIARLEASTKLPAVVAQLLVSRGIYDAAAADAFMDVRMSSLRDPSELPGMDPAADLLHQAIAAGRRIIIYGDYDADGMTSTAILLRCIKLLGGNVGYFVPNRMDDGYGLNDESLRTLAQRGAEVVVTVDCGIASLQQARTARELGLTLIITDHHEFAAELPDAAAIVHPRLPGHQYEFGDFCGAGVAFKLAWALCQRASQAKRVSERMRNFLLEAIGLAAIGTVADVVPLCGENRIIVRHGLESLKHRPTLGVARLMRITEIDTRPQLASEDIGFTIAPRLNAAGRLGQAQLGVELLETDSAERAQALAEYIHELNNSRTSLERSIYLAANKQAKEQFNPELDAALVLDGRGWHPGVIGIVAGRLAEKFHRPVVLLALDQLGVKPATGSARSPGILNLHEAFAHCTEHLLTHGGHAAAAGLTLAEDRIEAFREQFCDYAAAEVSVADLKAELTIDAEAPLAQMTFRTIGQIEQLAPFGQGNPRPLLCTTGVRVAGPPKRIGSGERHLSLKLEQHGTVFRAVAFGQGEWADDLSQLDGPCDIAYRPVINEFRGRRSVELHLVDWRVSQSPAALQS